MARNARAQRPAWSLLPAIFTVALTATVVGPAQAQPIIEEVLYDGEGGDADDVFTELSGPAGTNLDGWRSMSTFPEPRLNGRQSDTTE